MSRGGSRGSIGGRGAGGKCLYYFVRLLCRTLLPGFGRGGGRGGFQRDTGPPDTVLGRKYLSAVHIKQMLTMKCRNGVIYPRCRR